MDQIEIFDIPSPCKPLCESDKQGYCFQCNLSRTERANWSAFTNPEKNKVLKLCRQRAARRRYLWLQQKKLQQTENSDQLALNF